MPAEKLTEIVQTLSPQEEEAVREFIRFLKHRAEPAPTTSLLAAVDEFIEQHPGLLRRLAQ